VAVFLSGHVESARVEGMPLIDCFGSRNVADTVGLGIRVITSAISAAASSSSPSPSRHVELRYLTMAVDPPMSSLRRAGVNLPSPTHDVCPRREHCAIRTVMEIVPKRVVGFPVRLEEASMAELAPSLVVLG
jgi:hypothetical protein